MLTGFAASDPVVTSVSLAAFAGARRPHTPRRTHSDPGRFQIGAGGLPTHPGLLLDAPQWPSEPSQGNHLLFFRFAQDVAHIDEGYRALRRIQRPRASFSLAGFQVTFIGRFWVTPEAITKHQMTGAGRSWCYRDFSPTNPAETVMVMVCSSDTNA